MDRKGNPLLIMDGEVDNLFKKITLNPNFERAEEMRGSRDVTLRLHESFHADRSCRI